MTFAHCRRLLVVSSVALTVAARAEAEPAVRFSGSVAPLPPAFVSRELSAAQRDRPLAFAVTLRMRDFSDLQARVARGELVPRAELEARYLPLASDRDAVVRWLTEQGFEITGRDATCLGVFARGPVGQVAASFAVRFASVEIDGVDRVAALDSPSLPARIAAPLLGVHGLQPLGSRRRPVPAPLAGDAPAYFPSDLLRAYDGAALAVNGTALTGAGETIAIVIDHPPATSDLTQFWSAAGVNQSLGNYSYVQVNGGAPGVSSAESAFDAEWASGMAPGAKVRVYCAGSLDSVALDACFQKLLDELPANPSIHQLSLSVGAGETFTASAQLEADAQYFAALASQGVSTFAASGDGGSTPDDLPTGPGNTGPLQVESYASDPSVTGVGGTTLTPDTASGARATETAWSLSGGGASIHFARPPWQTGAGIAAGAFRLVPDVSLSADPSQGAYVVYGGVARRFGGTSWGAPAWAGVCALLNQARALNGNPPIGLLGPKIYPLAGSASFYDIVTGGNVGEARSGSDYLAGPGHDCVTGLGSPNLANFVAALVDPPATAPTGVVISQVYGGGGINGAPWVSDFIELYNRGENPVSLDGWSVQYTSANGSSWSKSDLAGTIQPHAYYLIKEAGKTPNPAGVALPTPDRTGTFSMDLASGKVALIGSTTPIPIGVKNPLAGGDYAVVDFVGYGGAQAYEGAAPAPGLSVTLAAVRGGAGVDDTGENQADFAAAAPAPRNSATRANAADLVAGVTHRGAFKQGDAAGSCAVLVSNAGPVATHGPVNVVLFVPTGLTAIGLAGAGWTVNDDLRSASRADALAAGASYPPLALTVRVEVGASATEHIAALVSGGGEFNTANNMGTDTIPIATLSESEAWRFHYFRTIENTGAAADAAIASGDGLPNLLKYALGLDPRVPAAAPVKVDMKDGRLRIFVAKNASATEVTFKVQVTGNLGAPESWNENDVTIDQNTATSLQAHDNVTAETAAARYIRLQVARP